MEYQFIKFYRGGYVTIIDPNLKPRILCFGNDIQTQKCISYLSNYRSKFGRWPHIDLSKKLHKIEISEKIKKRTPDEVALYINPVMKSENDLSELSLLTGVSYFHCIDFNYDCDNFSKLLMKGREFDGVVDEVNYINRLEHRLKIK